jgi:Na+-transporting methylmalonyl-CoA/oxaloacetate decarboxylase gamma subunit
VITAVLLGQSVESAIIGSVLLVLLMAALMRLMSRLRQMVPPPEEIRDPRSDSEAEIVVPDEEPARLDQTDRT